MKSLRIIFAALLCVAASAASAQTGDKYPSHPVKIIVPYAPGGATDIVARILADQLSKSLGQQFYVESKPGAFGMLAIEEMVKSPADGYHADDRQRVHQCDHADHLCVENEFRLHEGRGADHQCR